MNKIALGTAQFGMKYGINNKEDIVSDKCLFDLLDMAYLHGIDTLDTAHSYGNSESRIGDYLIRSNNSFNIISKLPRDTDRYNVKKVFFESLNRLKQKNIYGYLIHNYESFKKDKLIINELYDLQESGFLKKIGFSLYYPEELNEILFNNIKINIVQVPYNLIDRRFEKYFSSLKEKNIEINVRSVFLQGLFFISYNKLPDKFLPFKEFVNNLWELCKKEELDIASIALGFATANNHIDRVIIGVDNKNQLLFNLENNKQDIYLKYKDITEKIVNTANIPERLLIPMNWS